MKRIFTMLFSAVIFLTFSENTFAQKQTIESDNLVFVKGGTFLSTSDTKNPNDYKQHRETVEDFYISKYEVTVDLYKSVTGKNPTSARARLPLCYDGKLHGRRAGASPGAVKKVGTRGVQNERKTGMFIVLHLLLFRKEPVEYIVGKSYPACLIVVGSL